MKVFLKNAIIKKILIVFITIIMVSNFVMPNYVCAADPGKQLVSGFFYLLSYLGDAAIQIMQELMIGSSSIGNENTGYRISYSPGMIFSNEIPALDINFINPMEDKVYGPDSESYVLGKDVPNYNAIIDRMTKKGNVEKVTDWWNNEHEEMWNEIKESYGYYDNTSVQLHVAVDPKEYLAATGWQEFWGYVSNLGFGDGITYYSALWYNGNTAYMLVSCVLTGRFGYRRYSRY